MVEKEIVELTVKMVLVDLMVLLDHVDDRVPLEIKANLEELVILV